MSLISGIPGTIYSTANTLQATHFVAGMATATDFKIGLPSLQLPSNCLQMNNLLKTGGVLKLPFSTSAFSALKSQAGHLVAGIEGMIDTVTGQIDNFMGNPLHATFSMVNPFSAVSNLQKLAGVVGALAGSAAGSILDTMRLQFEAFTTALPSTMNLIHGAQTLASGLGDRIATGISNMLGPLTSSTISTGLGGFVSGISNGLSSVSQMIGRGVSAIGSGLNTMINGLMSNISGLQNTLNSMTGQLVSFIQPLMNLSNSIALHNLSRIPGLDAVMNGLLNGPGTALRNVIRTSEGVIASEISAAEGAVSSIVGAVTDAAGSIVSKISLTGVAPTNEVPLEQNIVTTDAINAGLSLQDGETPQQYIARRSAQLAEFSTTISVGQSNVAGAIQTASNHNSVDAYTLAMAQNDRWTDASAALTENQTALTVYIAANP